MITRILNYFGYVKLETAENWVSSKNKRINQQSLELEAMFNRCNIASRRLSRSLTEVDALTEKVKMLQQANKTKVVTNGRKEH